MLERPGNLAISTNFYEQADSARALAALLVLLGHSYQIIVRPVYQDFFGVAGVLAQTSVMVFFALSGFLIGQSIQNNKKNNQGTFNIDRYMVSRAKRIYPPLIISLIFTGFLFVIAPYFFETGSHAYVDSPGMLARQGFDVSIDSMIGNLLFLNGFVTINISANGALWSLPVEVWYYIIGGLLFTRSLTTCLLIPAILFVTLSMLNEQFMVYSYVWGGGLLMSQLLVAKVRVKAYAMALFGVLMGGIGIMLAYDYASQYFIEDKNIDYSLIENMNIATGLSFCSVLYLVALGSIKLPKIFKGWAACSYTIYIFHFPILLFIYGCFQSWLSVSVFNAIIGMILSCIVIAYISRLLAPYIEGKKMYAFMHYLLNIIKYLTLKIRNKIA